MANKLDTRDENPLDQLLINLAERVSGLFKKAGATPNFITTLSIISGGLAIRAVANGGEKTSFAGWALLSYFFDCLDGHFARKYNMCSKFGDYYDHLSDWLYYGALFYVAFVVRGLNSVYRRSALLIFGALALAALGMTVHFGCQEAIYSATGRTEEAPTIGIFRKLCPQPTKLIRFTRWLGCGTFTALVIATVVVTVR